jgi:hypothetical protein
MNVHIGLWDLALLLVVSIQATLIAYLHQPRWKALLLSLPFPFTVATLALGRPLNATHVLGLLLLLVFTQGVRLLHHRARVPIVPAIILAAGGYCLLGGVLARLLPDTEAAFWAACAGNLVLGAGLYRAIPHRVEPGHRSPLPVWIKLPIVIAVVAFLVVIKQTLSGFITLFPMVGVVAAYEARHSLWTMGRQIPVVMLTFVPMMAAGHLAQERLGLGPALAFGWVVLLGVLIPLTRATWIADARRSAPASESPLERA